jgi:hypothetical protein
MWLPSNLKETDMGSASLRMVLVSIVSFTIATAPAMAQSGAGATEDAAANIVATQIRKQGYACQEPSSAKRDLGASKPDQAAWILTCKNATYRVRLVPDQAAKVEQID